jgi:NitT/TauT family transport system ATP-binding protein
VRAARLQVERVSRRYRDPSGADREALRDVSLDIAPGEFVALLGASGCGKTTLLNLLAGFDRPTRGRVLADGREVAAPSPKRVCMFQGYALFPWRSVQANVEYGLEVRGTPRADRRATAAGLLELVGLSAFADHRPHQLSGGMQQRAALARALAVDPECLLMDEPFGALDALTRARLQDELARIAQAQGKTVVFVTHDVDEAVLLADRVVVMVGGPGRIQRVLPVPLARPRSRTSPDFLAVRGEVYRALESAHVLAAP